MRSPPPTPSRRPRPASGLEERPDTAGSSETDRESGIDRESSPPARSSRFRAETSRGIAGRPAKIPDGEREGAASDGGNERCLGEPARAGTVLPSGGRGLPEVIVAEGAVGESQRQPGRADQAIDGSANPALDSRLVGDLAQCIGVGSEAAAHPDAPGHAQAPVPGRHRGGEAGGDRESAGVRRHGKAEETGRDRADDGVIASRRPLEPGRKVHQYGGHDRIASEHVAAANLTVGEGVHRVRRAVRTHHPGVHPG